MHSPAGAFKEPVAYLMGEGGKEGNCPKQQILVVPFVENQFTMI